MPYKDAEKAREYARKYRQNHPLTPEQKERKKIKHREWQQQHPEKTREYTRKFKEKGGKALPGKRAEYARKYYHSHKEYMIQKNRKWSQKNREKRRLKKLLRRIELIMAKGGKCELCGYNKHLSALEFHHIKGNKEGKYFWLKNNFDLNQVMLVCANCHRAFHNKDAHELYQELWKESQTVKVGS